MKGLMMRTETIPLGETSSTSDFLRGMPTPAEGEMTVAEADYQTAGRGMATNKWGSERDKNLLFSILTSPRTVDVRQQFILSMAGALALKATLDRLCGDIRLKWPNDIYWRDLKLSGTLIETAVRGKTIERCIHGIGLNVNQRTFLSGAPNPVSLYNITGHETRREELLESILADFAIYYTRATDGDADGLTAEYNAALYRNDHLPHPYEDCVTGEQFRATIDRVGTDGLLRLTDTDGHRRAYSLKEVKHIME